MFGLLKKKFKDFTDKILGKTQEKINNTKDIQNMHIPENTNQENKSVEKESLLKNTVLTENIGASKDNDYRKVNYKKIVLENSQEQDSEKDTNYKEVKDHLKPKKNVRETQIVGQASKKKYEINTKKSEEYKSLSSKSPEKIKKSLATSIKSIFSSKIKLTEKEVESFLDDFELSLLEADVSINSSRSIVDELKKQLINNHFSKSNLIRDIKLQIKKSLISLLDIDCNMDNYIKDKSTPLIILFVGPNGVGKTTTIAKFANLYKNKNKSVILSSSDTFRAGSIDQLEKHAKNIGVRIIKQKYGSDPAAVAYDAVSSAKANNIDVVLIDTAGRQETNVNLMQELRKIKRVVNPSLVIYVGEAQSGQAIIDQISKFDKEIGINGVILTKIDTDPKGGVAISILNELKKPIFFIGTGQEYTDIIPFNAEYIINRII